ncbi:MAG: hypothetical protein Q7S50_00345 [bacterium]|nr:hypothetical protein [bacterium]
MAEKEKLKNYHAFLWNEILLLLKSRNRLLWIVIGLWLTTTIRTQYGNFHNHDGAIDILTSLAVEIIGLVALLSFLRWRGKLAYTFIALYALVAFFATVFLIYLWVENLGLSLIQAEPYLVTTLSLDVLITVLSVPMFILAVQHLLFTIKMENKLKTMSIPDLLRDYFEATVVYWECARANDSSLAKIERKAGLDSTWTLYELKKRDPHLEELVKGMANEDDEVKNKTADEVIEKYGEKVLDPLKRNWKVRESHYFSKKL